MKPAQKSIPKKRNKHSLFDIYWNNKYQQLIKFKTRFHHCNVLQHWKEDAALGRWVIRQRVRKDLLAPERIEKLNRLGFIWNIPDHAWNVHYRQLVVFKNKYGHCLVSKGSPRFYELAEWVGKQRRDKMHNLKRLTREKIRKLNAIGFYWGRRNASWQKRFGELKDFKRSFGHCNVPQLWKGNKPLAAWVSTQRTKRNKLSREQRQKLNSIGFAWRIRLPRKEN